MSGALEELVEAAEGVWAGSPMVRGAKDELALLKADNAALKSAEEDARLYRASRAMANGRGFAGVAEAILEAEKQRGCVEMAVADNAALVEAMRSASADVERLSGYTKKAAPLASTMRSVISQPHPGAALLERLGRLEKSATKAAAELRHAYRAHGQGQRIDPNLVTRAIRLLEEATNP